MKKFLKQKFSKRLLNLLNFRRNRRPLTFKSLGQVSTPFSLVRLSEQRGDDLQDKSFFVFPIGKNQQNVNQLNTDQSFNDPLLFSSIDHSKTKDFISSLVSVPQTQVDMDIRLISSSFKSKGVDGDANDNIIIATLKKKKFALRSFLYSAVCKFPRKFVLGDLDDVRPRKYFTIPYRLSFSGFICNKVLTGYYNNLSHKVLFALHKKIKIRAKKSDKLSDPFDSKTGSNSRRLTLPQKKKEIAKDLILNLESRLDSSVLRLLQFKSVYTFKRSRTHKFSSASKGHSSEPFTGLTSLGQAALKRSNLKSSNYKVKAPWKNYSALHVKQQISHGHIYINGKKNKCHSTKLRPTDQITISTKGFFPSLLKEPTSLCNGLFQQAGSSSGHDLWRVSDLTFESQTTPDLKLNFLTLCIKNWKIKRFTEIFYVTYKNFHFLSQLDSRLLSDSVTQSDRTLSPSSFSTETWQDNHFSLKPLFQRIGYNQSIFFLWPVVSLLSVETWKPEIKRLILGSPSWLARKSRLDNDKLKKSLRDLLVLKKLTSSASASIEDDKNLNLSRVSIPEHFVQICRRNPSWLHSTRFTNYASIVYGTRKCKWVQFQQGKKNAFWRDTFNKIQFLELELDFFQLSYRYYRA
jgi:ribosomal protein S4